VTARVPMRVGWVAWSLSCLSFLGYLYLLLSYGALWPDEPDLVISALETSSWVLVSTLALLVIRSQPRNQVGWWLMAVGVSSPLEEFLTRFAHVGYQAWGATALVVGAAWVVRWIWIVGQVNIPFILLYYPTGRVPSSRWRPVELFMWGLVAFNFVLAAFGTGSSDLLPELGNPLGIDFLPKFGDNLLTSVDMIVLSVLPLLGLIGVISRYRRSSRVVRLQIKMIAWVPLVAAFFFASPFLFGGRLSSDFWAVASIVFSVFVVTVITAGIVRYKLFEIDRLMSRTVSYAIVVVLLAGIYLALVTAAATFLPSQNPLAIAASTLIVAALFNPLRRRVQSWVDHRFNRSRYDAERVMDEFAGSLRDRVDPDEVVDDWIDVVAETMQPAAIGVWVRED
jgi:hypothetical protein